MIESYTNTALATARRCLREYDLAYRQRLERADEDRETLVVGQTYHRAFDAAAKGLDPFAVIERHAPGELWTEKIRRLYAANVWYWRNEPIDIVETERIFSVEIAGIRYRGQIDAIVRAKDGRLGVLERKTTASGVDAESDYWDRLRLDVQVGLYSLACGERPAFILYDVTRKPTINPKALTKADMARLRKELTLDGKALYFETFEAEDIEEALYLGHETPALYGARLTSDIGNRPDYYFARREVARTSADYEELLEDLSAQVAMLEAAETADAFHRNPDACATFGRCKFFGLCSNNRRPRIGDAPPDGFRIREHVHPELVREPDPATLAH